MDFMNSSAFVAEIVSRCSSPILRESMGSVGCLFVVGLSGEDDGESCESGGVEWIVGERNDTMSSTKNPFDEAPRMPDRLIYRSDMMTKSHRVHNRWEPEHPRDFDPESRNSEMFGITYKLTRYLMCNLTSSRRIQIHKDLYEDDILIIARDKTNKRNAKGHEIDEHITGRTEWHKTGKCVEYFQDQKIAKIEIGRMKKGTP
nr:hypothetical protein [Tanacetum cinerariifolium]